MTFRDAYLKLTGFYVLIIMLISLLFSVWVYTQATQELKVGLALRLDQFGRQLITPDVTQFVQDRLNEGRLRIIFNLTLLNLAVLVGGAAASYFLARRTMRPIEEAMEAKDRFTADASHELRTPLAAMKAEIEVALRDKKRSKSDTEELLHSNLEEIDRLSGLAEGLLVLTNGQDAAQLSPVRIDEVVEKVCHRFMTLAEKKNILIHSKTEEVTATTNALHLEKIVGILIDNAIKYSPKRSEITVAVKQENGRVIITVQDRGYGIKASDLPHIFDRFYRADASRSKEHVAGHGLGLSIAHKLADSLNATLSAESTSGEGSVFILDMPRDV